MKHRRSDKPDLHNWMRFGFAAILAIAVATFAGGDATAVELKSRIVVDADVVTLGDLLEGLEDIPGAAEKVVANAPAPGTRGRIHVATISSAARIAGVPWRAEVQTSRITVERSGRKISVQDLEAIIADAVTRNYEIRSFRLNLPLRSQSLFIPTDNALTDVRVDDIVLDTRTDRYVARLSLPTGSDEWTTLSFQGRLERVTNVPTLARTITAGETITSNDIRWVELTQRQVGFNTLRDSDQVVGMTPRRNIVPGRPIRNGELERPALVKKGNMVTLSYQIGNLTITAVGRAMERGGRDEVIRVLNTASNKTVEARITGPDKAEVLTPGRLAIAGSNY